MLAVPPQWTPYIVGGVVCWVSAHFLLNRGRWRKLQAKIQERGERSKAGIERLRDKLQRLQINNDITKLSFQELQVKLRGGDLTAVDVLHAYQLQALKVNDKVNAITDVIETARAQAKALDNMDPSERGPLHGIPISVKESCVIKGEDCTSGFGELIDIYKTEDSVLIQVLKAKGAVPFVRTNLPQGLRSVACNNPIYGETLNPHNLSRGPGGSSGGEGAIIGGQGAILGVGGDTGGSVRVPAHYCGICALKPTAGRLSSIGNLGSTIVFATEGPMSRDVEGLVHFVSSVLGPELFSLDPFVPPVPFREEVFHNQQPLRIGYYLYDNCTRCVPAVERAVTTAKTLLESLGHTLVEIQPYKPDYAFKEILMPAVFADDGEMYKDLMKYDTGCDAWYDMYKFQKGSYAKRWLVAKINGAMSNDPMTTSMMERQPIGSVVNWFKKTLESRKYVKDFTDNWRSQQLDAVICPVMPCPANIVHLQKDLLGAVSYTALYNIVNFPAGALPITAVTDSDVTKTKNPAFYNAETAMEKQLQKDAEGSQGLPVGIQVVGLPYMEEVVLRIMAELETALKSDTKHT